LSFGLDGTHELIFVGGGLTATHLGLGDLAQLLADQGLVYRVVSDIVSCVPPLLKGRDPGVVLRHDTVVVKTPEGNLLDGRDVPLVRGWDRGVDAHGLAVHDRSRDLGALGHEVSESGICPGRIGWGRWVGS
jgi:hypothetical protein